MEGRANSGSAPARLTIRALTPSRKSTSAFQVTGKSVRIGKSCRVEVVEYSEDIHIEEGRSVRVGSVRKIEPSEQRKAFEECAKRLEPNVPFVAKEIAKLQRSDKSGHTVSSS